MDLPAVIAKIIGAALLIWTAFSIFKHFSQRRQSRKNADNGTVLRGNAAIKIDKKYSLTEHLLNNLLLYLWFAFLVTFSLGMILNN
jgi:threonine/homoserine/homoserine lactone efflux protein